MKAIYRILIRLLAFSIGTTIVIFNADKLSSLFGGYKWSTTFRSAGLPGKESVSRAVREYCNNPHEISRGDEGRVPSGYELVSLHMMIRHGNRLPMGETPGIGPFDKPDVSCRYDLSKSTNPNLLKRYIDTVDRDVKRRLKTPDPEPELCSDSFLTQIGVEQHLANGRILNQVYLDSLSLKQSDVLIYCTKRQRTVTSVFALLSGLLDDFQPERIKPNMVDNIEFCHKQHADVKRCTCKRAVNLFSKAEGDMRKRLSPVDMNHKQAVESVKETVQLNDIDLIYPWKLGLDFMALPMCRGEELPKLDDGRHLTVKQLDMIWESILFFFKEMFKDEKFKRSAQLAMYPLHKSIRYRLEQQIDQSERGADVSEKLTIFSGHDNSIHPLLLSMNIQLSDWPPYASRFIIEVYRPIESDLTHVIRFIYDGRDITSYTDFCRGSPCELENYINWVDGLMYRLGYKSYEQACSDD